MRKVFIILLSVFIPFRNANIHITSGGTYIIGAISKDGIIVGSDSRDSWLDNDNKTVVAYTDNAQKIFVCKNVLFAMAGQYSFGNSNIRFTGLMSRFIRINSDLINADNFYNKLLEFSKRDLGSVDFKLLLGNQFLVAGYVNNKPVINYYYNGKVERIASIGFVDNFPKMPQDVITGFGQKLSAFNLNQCAGLIENVINSIIQEQNQKKISNVGGIACLWVLNKDGKIGVKKRFVDNYGSTKSYLQAILDNKVRLKYRSKDDSVSFRYAFGAYINSH